MVWFLSLNTVILRFIFFCFPFFFPKKQLFGFYFVLFCFHFCFLHSNIPFYGYNTISFFLFCSGGVFNFLLLQMRLLCTFVNKALCKCAIGSPGQNPRRMASSCDGCTFNMLRNYQSVVQGRCAILPSHQEYMEVPVAPYFYQDLIWSSFFKILDTLIGISGITLLF